jgi:uncharacterized protein (DUF58 family)
MQLAFRILGLSARLLTALGVVCILLGLYLLWQTQIFDSATAHTTGAVVSYREVSDGKDTRFRPRVRFSTASGDIVTFDGQMSTTTKRLAEGSPVPVVYPVKEPMRARIDSFTDNWLGACIAGVLGALTLFGAFFIRRSAKREAAKA